MAVVHGHRGHGLRPVAPEPRIPPGSLVVHGGVEPALGGAAGGRRRSGREEGPRLILRRFVAGHRRRARGWGSLHGDGQLTDPVAEPLGQSQSV